MINKNFKALFSDNYATTGTGLTITFKGTNGNNVSADVSYRQQWASRRKLILGSGTTQPTTNDYSLENQISNLTTIGSTTFPTSSNRNTSYETASNMLIQGITVKNNTSDIITVSELAIYMDYPTSGSTQNAIIINREVITPVQIQPNETYTFVVTIG